MTSPRTPRAWRSSQVALAGYARRLGGHTWGMLSARGRSGLAVLATALTLVIIDIFVGGPLVHLDLWVHHWDGERSIPSLDAAAWVYDKVGQRTVTIPLLLLVAGYFGRRHRTWRPVVLAVMTVLALNLVVGAMKILIGRSETETGNPDVLNGGMIFPSGHSSNMVLSGGLIIYLFIRYTKNPPVRAMVAGVAAATSLTIATSLYIGSHWVSDLIGGALVGGLLLQSVVVFDRATRFIRTSPPALVARSPLLQGLLEADGDGVDAVPVSGGSLGRVVEDMPEVRPAPPAPDLRTTHAD